MGKEAFLHLHLHESRLLTSGLRIGSALLRVTAYIQHMHCWWRPKQTWMCLITYGVIILFAMATTKLWWRQMASIWMYIHIFATINLSLCTFLWNINHHLYLSLFSSHICIYFLHHLRLYAFFPSPALSLFLSLTIAYEVSLQNTNVLQSPWKQCEQRGRPGTVREFLWCWRCYQMHSSLVRACVCVCTCMAHVQQRVSEVLSSYFCELAEIHPMTVCFPCTCLQGCAAWMPAAPPHRCQALLSCSWLSSQALCRVSQLRSAS